MRIHSELETILDHLLDTEELQDFVSQLRSGNIAIDPTDPLIAEEGEIDEEKTRNLAAVIKTLKLSERVKLAIFGNQTARGLLIRDSYRQIPLLVLQNGKLTESEVAEFAKNPNLDEQIFRNIAQSSNWMKSPAVKFNLVSNPKTPVDVSLKWIKYLQGRELKVLSRSKSIPQIIATQAKKLMDKE
jgi:hypothetical protein